MNKLIIIGILLLLIIIMSYKNREYFDNLYAPEYNPEKYNKDPNIRRSHNCYSYMLNRISNKLASICKQSTNQCRFINPQPGHFSGVVTRVNKSETTCPNLMNRVISDNPEIKIVSFNEKCPENSYKGALAVNPNVTYHFYRENNDGYWSHKDGGRKATNVDASGNMIIDPYTSDRKWSDKRHYKDFCGYFCIPNKKMNMTRRNNGEPMY